MKEIGLLGGSFNPVHNGHTMLAAYLAQWAQLDEVWMVLSQLSPFKMVDGLRPVDASSRMAMLELALADSRCVRPCDIELHLPSPSYTINTLRALAETHPECRFRWIIGSDNWADFNKWRQWSDIISEFGLLIYPRPGYDIDPATLPANVRVVEAPTFELSSSMVRKALAQGLDMNLFLPTGVYDYILNHGLYGTRRS